MTPEQRLYGKFVTRLKGLFQKGSYRIQRIETSTNTGVPDIYFRCGDYACWIETKTLDYKVTPEQWAWAWTEQLAGGECWICTEIGGLIVMIPFDRSMLDFSSLRGYVNNVVHIQLSIEGWWARYDRNTVSTK